MTVFKIIHEQSLHVDEHNQITEVRPWTRIEISYAAIQTGWLKQFKPNWLDLAVLETIGLHARPLVGEDFRQLLDHGLASPSDQGRLYARITDGGLATILGCDRKWVSRCGDRLGEKGLLRVLKLPKGYRDSRGLFSGNSAFLLAGEVLTHSSAGSIRGYSLPTVDSDRGYSLPTVDNDRGYSLPTVTGHNRLHRGYSLPTKNITLSSTLSDESGTLRVPADLGQADKTVLASDDENAADQLTLERSDNGNGAYRAAAAAETAAGAYRSQGDIWQRLNAALSDEKTAAAFQAALEAVESRLGLTEVGLRVARLAFAPMPDRRRRVLEDLRRMQGRDDLKASVRKRNIIGILTQNIGVTLGLGLAADGSIRTLADRSDYTAVGGLVDHYGAEVVWLTACGIAGQPFEGDPIEYLRAALRNKRDRGTEARPSRSFENIDYLSEQVGIGEA
jgi:hypothetical protein